MMQEYNYFDRRQLQPWYKVRIDRSGDSVVVYFCSRIHINKIVRCSILYSHTYSDAAILIDHNFVTWVYTRYGVDIHTCNRSTN